jgi:hypothetical protein
MKTADKIAELYHKVYQWHNRLYDERPYIYEGSINQLPVAYDYYNSKGKKLNHAYANRDYLDSIISRRKDTVIYFPDIKDDKLVGYTIIVIGHITDIGVYYSFEDKASWQKFTQVICNNGL